MSDVLGYDSWGNTLPAPENLKFVGRCFNNYWNPLMKHPIFDEQYEKDRAQGKLVVAYILHRGQQMVDPVRLAEWALRELPDDVAVAGDYEDQDAPKGVQTVLSIQKFGGTLYNEGRYDLSYTAPWIWNDRITPYDLYFYRENDGFDWNPYKHDYWHCDPPPFGPLSGDWTEWAVHQDGLNLRVPWANAAIDTDTATQEWYDKMLNKYMGAPPPTDLKEILNSAIADSEAAIAKMERVRNEL